MEISDHVEEARKKIGFPKKDLTRYGREYRRLYQIYQGIRDQPTPKGKAMSAWLNDPDFSYSRAKIERERELLNSYEKGEFGGDDTIFFLITSEFIHWAFMTCTAKRMKYHNFAIKPHEAAVIGMAREEEPKVVRRPNMLFRRMLGAHTSFEDMSEAEAELVSTYAHMFFGMKAKNLPTGPVGTIQVMQYYLEDREAA